MLALKTKKSVSHLQITPASISFLQPTQSQAANDKNPWKNLSLSESINIVIVVKKNHKIF